MPAGEDADAFLSDKAARIAGRGRGGGRGGGRDGAGGPGQGPRSYAAQRDLKLLQKQTENKCPIRGFDVFAVPADRVRKFRFQADFRPVQPDFTSYSPYPPSA